jgi:hypothetical protein
MLSNCSVRELATAARNIGQVGMTEAATLRWTVIYTALAVGAPSDETNYELRIGTNYAPALVLGRMDRARTGHDPYLPAATVVDVVGEPGRVLRRGRGGGARGVLG